jgi:hypothetical protein
MLLVQHIGFVDIERLSTVGNTRCTVPPLDHSSPAVLKSIREQQDSVT